MVSANILEHMLVSRHEVLPPAEKKQLLDKFKITKDELPKIYHTDPVCKHIKVKVGDVIKITRQSPTAGQTLYYRVVVEG